MKILLLLLAVIALLATSGCVLVPEGEAEVMKAGITAAGIERQTPVEARSARKAIQLAASSKKSVRKKSGGKFRQD